MLTQIAGTERGAGAEAERLSTPLAAHGLPACLPGKEGHRGAFAKLYHRRYLVRW
jgi:hypothetical protein